MGWVSAHHVLGLPVRVRGIELGRSVDLVLDRAARRVLGFDVRCGDEERRFLPLAVVAIGKDDLVVSSPLVLLEEPQLAFYTSAGSSFRSLRGGRVIERGATRGVLADVMFEAGGEITSLLVSASDGPVRVGHGPDVELARPRAGVRAAS